jgi:hypothetical protein
MRSARKIEHEAHGEGDERQDEGGVDLAEEVEIDLTTVGSP